MSTVHATYQTTVISVFIISFLLILSLTIIIAILVIHRVKFQNRTPDDIEARKGSDPRIKVENITDVPAGPNQAYVAHNIASRCTEVSTHANEAYGVCDGIRDNEPVYELVK